MSYYNFFQSMSLDEAAYLTFKWLYRNSLEPELGQLSKKLLIEIMQCSGVKIPLDTNKEIKILSPERNRVKLIFDKKLVVLIFSSRDSDIQLGMMQEKTAEEMLEDTIKNLELDHSYTIFIETAYDHDICAMRNDLKINIVRRQELIGILDKLPENHFLNELQECIVNYENRKNSFDLVPYDDWKYVQRSAFYSVMVDKLNDGSSGTSEIYGNYFYLDLFDTHKGNVTLFIRLADSTEMIKICGSFVSQASKNDERSKWIEAIKKESIDLDIPFKQNNKKGNGKYTTFGTLGTVVIKDDGLIDIPKTVSRLTFVKKIIVNSNIEE